MRREAEPFGAPSRHLARIDRLAAGLAPDDPQLADWTARYLARHRSRLAADCRLVERHAEPGARILDCGAVPPVLAAALTGIGYRVRGVDLAPERFAGAIADLALDVERCDLETEPLPFPEGSFDLVLFNELFEHLRLDPIATLAEVRRVLTPGGLLLLSTPNLRSFRGLRHLLLEGRSTTGAGGVYDQYEKLRTLGHMGHVREYTPQEVGEFLGRVGFRVEIVIYRGGHGRGLVGVAERLAPSFRPFFSLVAVRPEETA